MWEKAARPSEAPNAARHLAVLWLGALFVSGCGGEAPADHPGKETYNRYCFSCHQAGVAGAPKYGDAETWGPRLAKSREVLLDSVVVGMPPAMPARGLCSTCDEARLGDALDYLLDSVRAPE